MRIYTRRGDQGETELCGGTRVAKDAPRLETYGTLDELNAVLGMVRAESLPKDIDGLLGRLQDELMVVTAELATTQGTAAIGPSHVEALEESIDRYQAELKPLTGFILPTGTRAAATMHLARTVCRRGERCLVTLVRDAPQPVSPHLTAYLNRLSDLLFVLARAVNARAGGREVLWRRES